MASTVVCRVSSPQLGCHSLKPGKMPCTILFPTRLSLHSIGDASPTSRVFVCCLSSSHRKGKRLDLQTQSSLCADPKWFDTWLALVRAGSRWRAPACARLPTLRWRRSLPHVEGHESETEPIGGLPLSRPQSPPTYRRLAPGEDSYAGQIWTRDWICRSYFRKTHPGAIH